MIKWLQRPIDKDVSDCLAFLLQSQFWPLDKIREYQLAKIQRLLEYSVRHVPYYRNLFKKYDVNVGDIRSFSDFLSIPPLTKGDIQNNFDDLIVEGSDPRFLTLNSTGGSTGVPLNFYHDGAFKKWADAARVRAWKYMVGLRPADLESVLWGAVRDVGKGFNVTNMVRNIIRDRCLTLNTFDLDEKSLKRFIRIHNILRPPLIRGYASSLYYVARYVLQNSIKIYKPKAIISSTEVLHKRMRQVIEEVFSCKVFDSYGCREVSQIATECGQHNGFHVVFENQYVELDGKDLLVTNLNNYVMPFIRYKVGDLASSIDSEPCPCGRKSPRIVNLLGRDNDNVELSNGKVINGEFFEFLFFGIKSVIQYQIIHYSKKDLLEVRLLLKDKSVDVGKIVKDTMLEKFSYENTKIIYTDQFDKTPTGKLRFVYSVD